MKKLTIVTIALTSMSLPLFAQSQTGEKTISLSSLMKVAKKKQQRENQGEEVKSISLSSLIRGAKNKQDTRQEPDMSITAKGICGDQMVLIGQEVSALPKTFPGLYDAFTVSTEDDEGEVIQIVTFTLAGKETMTAICYDQKTIANIDVRTPSVYVKVGQTYYACGQKIAGVKSERGVETDDYGNVSYQNIYFDEDTDGNICTIRI